MKDIISRNYESTCNRCKINDHTNHFQFNDKIFEEYIELKDSLTCDLYMDAPVIQCKMRHESALECTDIILTCLNYLVHSGYDPIKLMKEKISYNETRTD